MEKTKVEFLEGYNDHFAIRYSSGMQEIYKIVGEAVEKVGTQNSNITPCSLFYPNFALYELDKEVQLKFVV